jgi:hypothetical protein
VTLRPVDPHDPALGPLVAAGYDEPDPWDAQHCEWALVLDADDGTPIGLAVGGAFQGQQYLHHLFVVRARRSFPAMLALWRGTLAEVACRGARELRLRAEVDPASRKARLLAWLGCVVYAREPDTGAGWWRVPCGAAAP